jgi:hypothetical protein
MIAGKGGSNWKYAWIPVVGPILGGSLAGLFHQVVFEGGPKSRAGLIAYPVVPPNDKPILTIKKPTINGFNPEMIGTFVLVFGILAIGANKFADGLNPFIVGFLIDVPIISLKRFANVFGIAGPVANTPNFVPGSSVSCRWIKSIYRRFLNCKYWFIIRWDNRIRN